MWLPVESKQNAQLSESTELYVSNRTKQLLSSSEAGNPLLSASAKRNDLEKSHLLDHTAKRDSSFTISHDAFEGPSVQGHT